MPQAKEQLITDVYRATIRAKREKGRCDSADVHQTAWTYGGGTPFPEIPLSESSYDGQKPFDDCEPWSL